MKQNNKIGMSLALASLITLGVTGCGDSNNANDNNNDDVKKPLVVKSSTVDITVERGKVYDANVSDSSTPAQVAIQKSGKNIYTFAKAPTYPVVVNGGWIDVNDDGKMDTSDIKLDIEMKSYGTTVTPITTFLADVDEKVREKKLNDLLSRLNEAGIGSDTIITAKELLQVPSKAPRDVFVAANAIYKDIKEHSNALPSEDAVISQFTTINTLGTNANAKDFEKLVIADLGSYVEKISDQDVFEFKQDVKDAVVPDLAKALLLNKMTNMGFLDKFTFNSDYTLTLKNPKGIYVAPKWRVEGKKLIISQYGDDIREYTFSSQTPTNGSDVTELNNGKTTLYVINISNSAVTPPSDTKGDETQSDTVLDLSGYTSVIIYKNVSELTSTSLLGAYKNNAGFSSTAVGTAKSCTDFGFTTPISQTNVGGISTKTYSVVNMTTYKSRTCSEFDYTNASYGGGSENIVAYYNIGSL